MPFKEKILTINNETTIRIKYLDIAKAIGIILVVIGHIEKNHLAENISKFIFSFHMPLFFILSGIVINIKKEERSDFGLLCTKKLKSLMIPYFWFSLIFIIIDLVQLCLGYSSWAEISDVLIATGTFYADSTLWFLPALLISELLFIFMKKKAPKFGYVAIILLAAASYGIEQLLLLVDKDGTTSIAIVITFNLLRVMLRGSIGALFVLIGYEASKRMPKEKINISQRCIALIAGIVLLSIAYFVSDINTLVDLRRIEFGNIAFFILTSIAGSFGVIMLSISIWELRPLEFIGKNTLIIMASHLNLYILFAGMKFGLWVNNYVNHFKSYIFIINVLVVVFLLESILIYIIRRFTPFILGQKTGRRKA